MAHYAFLNSSNIVTEVIVGKDETDTSENWETYYGNIRGQVCKRTSYNTQLGVHKLGGTAFRKNYAGIGYSYDSTRDAFIPPQPYASWVLDESTCSWSAPVSMPTDAGEDEYYEWNESTTSWDLKTL
jgi:hypothetical protein